MDALCITDMSSPFQEATKRLTFAIDSHADVIDQIQTRTESFRNPSFAPKKELMSSDIRGGSVVILTLHEMAARVEAQTEALRDLLFGLEF